MKTILITAAVVVVLAALAVAGLYLSFCGLGPHHPHGLC